MPTRVRKLHTHTITCAVCQRDYTYQSTETKRLRSACSDCRTVYAKAKHTEACKPKLDAIRHAKQEAQQAREQERAAQQEARREAKRQEQEAKRIAMTRQCDECTTEYVAKYDHQRYCNPKCYKRAHRRERRARAKGAQGSYTFSEVMRLYLSIGKSCTYCHQYIRVEDIEAEHVVPLSRGGSNSLTNIVPSCGKCNRDKSDMTPEEWKGIDIYQRFVHLVKSEPTKPRWMTMQLAA